MMQSPDGIMEILTEEEVKAKPDLLQRSKILREGQYFKIKQCYFKITKIMPEGIEAQGVSRREYFENR